LHYPAFFLIIFISVAVIAFAMGLLVLHTNSKGKANRSFFALVVSVSIWSIGLGFATVAPNVETCEFWRRFAAFGWGIAFAIILHFILIITDNDSWVNKWWTRFLLYSPAIICVLAFGAPIPLNSNPYNLQRTQFGWTNVPEHNTWDLFFYAYYLSYTIVGLVLLYKWGRKATDKKTKKLKRLIFISFIATLILSSITDLLISDIPQMAPIILLLPIAVLYRVIVKYGFIVLESGNKKSHFSFVIMGVILYVILAFVQISLIRVDDSSFRVWIFDIYTVRGLIIQLQTFLSIYMVIREDKTGFISVVIINVTSFVSSLSMAIRTKSVVPLPGTLSNAVTLFIIVAIVIYKKRTNEQINEINEQRTILEVTEQKLYRMAYYDSLTELHNKDWFIEQLNKSIHVAKRRPSMLGVIFLDLDSFKAINDTMGHTSGDTALKIIADRLKSCLREEDTISRFG